MKKVILMLVVVAMAGIYTANAQGGGGFQRRTPEEQLKQVKEKLADLKLTAEQSANSDSAFLNYFKSRDKIFEEMRAGGGQPDREAMREKNEKLTTERDDKLKKIFSDEQFKKWKDEIEPSLRPRRGPDGPGGQGGGGNQ